MRLALFLTGDLFFKRGMCVALVLTRGLVGRGVCVRVSVFQPSFVCTIVPGMRLAIREGIPGGRKDACDHGWSRRSLRVKTYELSWKVNVML